MTPVLFGTLTALLILLVAGPVARALRWHGVWGWAYRRYLRSWRWESLRADVLWRDDCRCQECGYADVRFGSFEVHHLRYHGWLWYALAPTLGLREDPDDLVTLCGDCHDRMHGRMR